MLSEPNLVSKNGVTMAATAAGQYNGKWSIRDWHIVVVATIVVVVVVVVY
jgi:t-SNARE complex subunit (syntaxin)